MRANGRIRVNARGINVRIARPKKNIVHAKTFGI